MPTSNNKSLSINKSSKVNDSVNPNYRTKKLSKRSLEEYVEGVKEGNRTILSQAITLIESSKKEYREIGQQILEECLPDTGNSVRIGVTGVPGVGKSTFIEALGQHLIQNNHRLAVLTIDPSSSRSKGSILGDKTRMQKLSTDDRAFIRPSPTSGTLGGVAQKTRETMLLCEAAGYDTIFIETVGVGQSETTAHSMVDFFLLLMLAGAGDELQGIKRGIMEMADLIAINKAEGDNITASKKAKREYENALSLFPPSPSGWNPKVITCSALQSKGIDEIWVEVQNYLSLTSKNGFFEKHRKEQAAYWMHETINRELKQKFYSDPGVKEKLGEFEKDVQSGKLSSFKAAKDLLKFFER